MTGRFKRLDHAKMIDQLTLYVTNVADIGLPCKARLAIDAILSATLRNRGYAPTSRAMAVNLNVYS
jgi:hypothetical protein